MKSVDGNKATVITKIKPTKWTIETYVDGELTGTKELRRKRFCLVERDRFFEGETSSTQDQ